MDNGETWDGSLILRSVKSESKDVQDSTAVYAGGVESDEPLARTLADDLVRQIKARKSTQHLYLDADRSYPPVQVAHNEIGQIFEIDWSDAEYTKSFSFRPTRTLYQEWHKYFIGLEGRSANDHIADIRRSRESGDDEPVFVDPFEKYQRYVTEVLPHLTFLGVEPTGPKRTILFDSSGLELPFSKLSGGEREIAFLVGQLVRFELERGLLLIDEPELHLNPDLVRRWLAFLQARIDEGQVWIATHSLEAVEVAGQDSTIVFERDPGTRLVSNPQPLAGRPILAVLSAAVGSPAFALAALRFVFVEGERHRRERELYHLVSGRQPQNRFLEGGGCAEVLRRYQYVLELAAETDEQINVGAIVDRDFRGQDEVNELESQGLHVLWCLEIENLFLDPDALGHLLDQAGRSPDEAQGILRAASDRFAGLWIAEHAAAAVSTQLDVPKGYKTPLAGQSFAFVQEHWASCVQQSSDHFLPENRVAWEDALDQAQSEYSELRDGPLWQGCLGKQTLGAIAPELKLSGAEALQQRVVRLWEAGTVAPSEPLVVLRAYLDGLSE